MQTSSHGDAIATAVQRVVVLFASSDPPLLACVQGASNRSVTHKSVAQSSPEPRD